MSQEGEDKSEDFIIFYDNKPSGHITIESRYEPVGGGRYQELKDKYEQQEQQMQLELAEAKAKAEAAEAEIQ